MHSLDKISLLGFEKFTVLTILCTTESVVHIWIVWVSSSCLARCVDGVMRYT